MSKLFDKALVAEGVTKRRGEVTLESETKKDYNKNQYAERKLHSDYSDYKDKTNAKRKVHAQLQKKIAETHDKKDPNKAEFVLEYHPDQRDRLKAEIRPLVNNPIKKWTIQENGKTIWFTIEMLVEKLKKDPMFDDKSRKNLLSTIRSHKIWIDSVYQKMWHPEQDDHLRTCLLFLDDCDWRVNGKLVTIKAVAKELSKHRILRDKTEISIFTRISSRKKYLCDSVLGDRYK